VRDLAPDIVRQRLLIEGYWSIEIDEPVIRRYLAGLAAHLGLRTYGDAVIFAPASGMGRDENAGWDAFVPLIDSGMAAYFWGASQFLAVTIYSCTRFDAAGAIDFTRDYFDMSDRLESLEF
jgi:hypothetical protein